MQKQKIKRIVFYRIGAIGDIMHALPLIKLTRQLNPLSTIELIVGSEQVKELLENSTDYITKIYCIKNKGIFDKPLKVFAELSETEKLLKESFKERPADEFIYLHSSFPKAWFLNKRIVKAKKLFIYKRDTSLNAVSNYVVTRYSDLRADLIENPFAVLQYQTLKPSSIDLTHGLPPHSAPRNDICIVLGVGSLRPDRAYPLLKWLEFIDRVLQTTDYDIKILGGPDESQLSIEFESLLEKRKNLLKTPDYSRIENLIGKTSLLELARVVLGSKKLYSADTGILHIAAALGVAVEAVFSITSEKRFGPFSPKAKALRSQSCHCKASLTNIPKHCSKLKAGLAACTWGVTIEPV